MHRPTLAISGQGSPESPAADGLAEECGRIAAERGAAVLTGGLAGVMAAAARGARGAGGLVVSILPGTDPAEGIADADVRICTGAGEGRDLVLVASADAVIAIGGGWGTLAEIALARKLGRRVVLLETWGIAPPPGWTPPGPEGGVRIAASPEEAVDLALAP
jgi:uncharacterized protein (TIGR00725 family)